MLEFIPIAHAVGISINTALPSVTKASNFIELIVGFYNLALMLAGGLAFGAVVYAGVEYAISAGNSSKQSEARDRILQAFLGILLLAGAYIFLNTINPAITKMTFPTLPAVPRGNAGDTPSLGDFNLNLMASGCGGGGGIMVGSCPDPNTQTCQPTGSRNASGSTLYSCVLKSSVRPADPCAGHGCSSNTRCAVTDAAPYWTCVPNTSSTCLGTLEGPCPAPKKCVNIYADLPGETQKYFQCK